MWAQNIYNWEYMYVYLGLGYDPNNPYHEIEPTFYVSKFKKYIKKYEKDWIKMYYYPNEKRLLEKHKCVYFIDNEDNITYYVAPKHR